MNPLDFDWKEDQQVTVTNPTADSYKFKVHNKDYELPSGATAKMPGYIAWIYVYGLASKLCQEDNNFNRWNEEGYRKEYYSKLVVGVDNLVQTIEFEPELVQRVDPVTDKPLLDDTTHQPLLETVPAPGHGGTYTPTPEVKDPSYGKVKPLQRKQK